MASRESARAKEAASRRVLDQASRQRRARKALEALEQDNFHDDPHANLVMSKKVPKFEESLEEQKDRKRKLRSVESFKMRYRKTFSILVEEEQAITPNGPNYLTAQAPASKFPPRHLCAVCGFPAPYKCIPCGGRFCCVKCQSTHEDTRCLKWTA